MMTTISFPAFSARPATCSAAQTAAPDEMPTSKTFLGGHSPRRLDGIFVR
jgi:hypothetical protein